MKLRNLFACAVASAMALVGCELVENTDLGTPSITLSESEISFDKDGGEVPLTVTATRDWTVKFDEAAAKWLVVDPASGKASAEPQTVTVSVLPNNDYSHEASVVFTIGLDETKLTVKQEGALGDPAVTDGAGTLESPYSASKALELATALGENDKTTGVYVQGTVKNVKEISVDFGNATYWITDDAGTVEFYVYRGKNLGNTSFTSQDQLKAGDKVVVYGDLMNYKGDSPQLGQGNYLVELNGEKNEGNSVDGGSSSDENAIYSNNFDKATASKNSSDKWPYCDEFDGWKNQAGTGAANVTYAFKSASARATSGNNNIWLPKTGGYLAVQDIALGGATSLELNFSVICGSPGNYKKAFSSSSFKVWLSADKAKWVELPVSVTANGTEFDSAVATFSVPSSTSSLSITFEKLADEIDGYRIDNVNLVSSTAAGTAIDFAQGAEKDFDTGSTTGGGDNGGDTPAPGDAPSPLIEVTVAEFLAAEESESVWYKLTGEITSIVAGNKYGNLYINDGTAEVYIYGLTNGWVGTNDQSFESIGLMVGDTVTLGTLRGSYNGEPQGGGKTYPAFYISHVPGDGGNDDGGEDNGGLTPPSDSEIDPDATIITLDASSKLCDAFPEGSTGVTETTSYTIDGYDWTFSPSSGNKFSWYTDGYVLWGKKNGYILLPSVKGKSLSWVLILTGKNASVAVQVGVYSEDGTTAVTGGEPITLDAKNSEFTYNLSGTETDARYRFQVVNDKNAQFQKLTLIYE